MNIKIITHQGGLCNFTMNNADTLMDLKMKIRGYFGLYFEEQILLFGNRTMDVNDQKLSEYGLSHGCSVKLLPNITKECFTINVSVLGKTSFDVLIRAKDTLSEVKEKIRNHCGLCPDEQILTFHGRILEGNKNISSYGVGENNTIIVIRKLVNEMQIFVKTMDGKTIAFEVTKNNKISDVKKKIHEKIGLSPDEQKLVYQGGILEDDKTIDEYQIIEKSVINVVAILRYGMQIFAKTISGKELYKIIDITKKIQQNIRLSPDEQKLVYQVIKKIAL